MKAIVAVDRHWGIGKDNELLYHNKKDIEFFKQKTDNKVVVMGRKTFESLPAPLKNRVNLVITSGDYEDFDNVKFGDINWVEKEIKKYDTNDVFIIGGESIYNHFLNRCDTIYVTRNKMVFDADTFMPNLAFERFIMNDILYKDDEIFISEWIISECNPYRTIIWLENHINNSIKFRYTYNLKQYYAIASDRPTSLLAEDRKLIYQLVQAKESEIHSVKMHGCYRVEINTEVDNIKLRIASFGETESTAYKNLLTSMVNLLS